MLYYRSDFGSGLTNQLFSIISSIIIAHKRGEKVVVRDCFIDEFDKYVYTPISSVFNLNKINDFLKKEYDVIIVDKYNIQFEIISINYKSNTHNINITNQLTSKYFINNTLNITNTNLMNECCYLSNINSESPFNVIFNYKINGYLVEEIYNKYNNKSINIDLNNSLYPSIFKWINELDQNMFENILLNIHYHDDYINKSNEIIEKFYKELVVTDDIFPKWNVIHLRLEEDALNHWSKQNNMNKFEFKTYIENKYINIIQKYISKTDNNIILSYSLENSVIDFMKNNEYNIHFNKIKYFEYREKNAIIDLLTSKICNNIFIGGFMFNELTGSTFSYYIGKIIDSSCKKISINLDKITNTEICYF
jgi:hypothetical protein